MVKADRGDSRKLAYLLAKGMLKRLWVRSSGDRSCRQLIRRHRQLIRGRVRTQNQIKSEVQFYGWSQVHSAKQQEYYALYPDSQDRIIEVHHNEWKTTKV